MSEKLIKELEAETLAALDEAPGTTTKEQLMDINYIRQATGAVAEMEKIELEKKKAVDSKRLENRKIKLMEKQQQDDHNIKVREVAVKEKLADIERAKLTLEEKQLATELEIEKIKSSASVKVANRGLLGNILKVGAFVVLSGVDLVNCYIDDGRTPKLFGMIHNGLSK